MRADACPSCGWTWMRANCLPGKDSDGRSYCFHAACDDAYHGPPPPD